jgi:hypothetical protein
MKSCLRSACLALSLGFGCGPTGAAARAPEALLVDGGFLANNGTSLGGGPGTGGSRAGQASAGGRGGSAGDSGDSRSTGGAPGSNPAPETANGGSGDGGTGGSLSPTALDAGASSPMGAGGQGTADASGGDASGPPAAVSPPAPTAAALLARLTACQELTTGRYPTDQGGGATVAICGLPGAVYWKADLDINCNGKSSAACNATTDSGYVGQTTGTDSTGGFLDAATLPFVVIPGPSGRFDYRKHDIAPGTVVAVIYHGAVVYGVFGQEGAPDIIGEASYAMAKKLGINADPETGGVDSGVSYIVFTGPTGQVSKLEDHDEAVRVGQARALELLR